VGNSVLFCAEPQWAREVGETWHGVKEQLGLSARRKRAMSMCVLCVVSHLGFWLVRGSKRASERFFGLVCAARLQAPSAADGVFTNTRCFPYRPYSSLVQLIHCFFCWVAAVKSTAKNSESTIIYWLGM
jgi:hypothetical protein